MVAERVGFEPTIRLRVFRFSRPVHSTTLPPLRFGANSTSAVPSRLGDDRFEPAHIGLKCCGHIDTTIRALIILEHCDERAPYGEA